MLDSITTDLIGLYRLPVLPGTDRYRVEVVPPDGYETVLRDQGGDDGLDSDVDPVSRRSDPLDGRRAHGVDAGLTPLSYIGDFAWLDADGDGIQDPDEKGLANVFVFLYRYDRRNDDFVFDELKLTGEDGLFEFGPRRPGIYQLRFLPPDIHDHIRFQAGANRAADSDAVPASGVTPDIVLPEGLSRDQGHRHARSAVASGDAPSGHPDHRVQAMLLGHQPPLGEPGPEDRRRLRDPVREGRDHGLAERLDTRGTRLAGCGPEVCPLLGAHPSTVKGWAREGPLERDPSYGDGSRASGLGAARRRRGRPGGPATTTSGGSWRPLARQRARSRSRTAVTCSARASRRGSSQVLAAVSTR